MGGRCDAGDGGTVTATCPFSRTLQHERMNIYHLCEEKPGSHPAFTLTEGPRCSKQAAQDNEYTEQ